MKKLYISIALMAILVIGGTALWFAFANQLAAEEIGKVEISAEIDISTDEITLEITRPAGWQSSFEVTMNGNVYECKKECKFQHSGTFPINFQLSIKNRCTTGIYPLSMGHASLKDVPCK